jgi:Na+/glutamate symporter
MPEGAAENYARATDTNLQAAAVAKRAAGTWGLFMVLVVGGTVAWAVMHDMKRERRRGY